MRLSVCKHYANQTLFLSDIIYQNSPSGSTAPFAAASRAGLNTPEDIALVGVDNDELLCENTKPTLSSVMPDFRSAGEKAAEMLTRRMAEIRFRAATGKSPLEAIHEIRRERALELLADPTRDRNAVANLCGYSSANALANFLRGDK